MINLNKDQCTGCKICTFVCPQNVIEIIDKKAKITNYTNCLECGACQLNCEYDAIDVSKGTGCLYAIIKEDILKITPKGTGCGCSNENEDEGCC